MSSTAAKKQASLLLTIGATLFFLGAVLFVLIYFPVAREEIRYAVSNPSKNTIQTIIPVDKQFSIVIPKISANSKVIANVDPYSEKQYQIALTRGVAHARGSALPNQAGNIFIFAHSAGNFYEANRFNAVFYLLTKLERGDEIYLFYKDVRYKYTVTDKKLVAASAVSYLSGKGEAQTLTLMTCWPPGTTFQRLLILAKISP